VTKYVLDTNLYVEATRDSGFAGALVQFTSMFLPQIYLHAIVVQELAIGAVHESGRRQLEREVVAPFERRGRVVVPGYRAWKRSGEVIAELVDRKVLSPGGFGRSFLSDVLLAVSCREEGLVILTRNTVEFDRISKVEPVRYAQPWPSA